MIVSICWTSFVLITRIFRGTITPPIPDGPFADALPKALAGFAGISLMSDAGNAGAVRPFTLDTRLDDLETDGRLGAVKSGTATASACGGSFAAFCCTGG